MTKLTARQKAFVQEYPVDLNATQAAIRAGYSKKTARVTACNLLTNPNIESALAVVLDERAKRTEVTADRVLAELGKVAFASMETYAAWDEDGVALVSSETLPAGSHEVVSEVSFVTTATTSKDGDVTERTTAKIKLFDKLKALEQAGRHLGMFKDNLSLTGKDGGPLAVSIMDLAKQAAAQGGSEGRSDGECL